MNIYEGVALELTCEQPYAYAGQCKAGAYAGGLYYLDGQVSGTSSTSGFGELESLLAGETFRKLAQGAYIFDKRNASDVYRLVIAGPMGKVELPALTIETWEETITFPSVDAALAHPGTMRGTTFVSLDIEAAIWRKAGARIGRKVGVAIVWEGDEG